MSDLKERVLNINPYTLGSILTIVHVFDIILAGLRDGSKGFTNSGFFQFGTFVVKESYYILISYNYVLIEMGWLISSR